MGSKVLTQVAVHNAKPGPTRREISDQGARGLHLVVQPSGAKSWCVRYRIGGKPAKLTLGSVLIVDRDHKEAAGEPELGTALTLAAARKLAAQALHQVQQGKNPGEAKKAASQATAAAAADTLQVVADEFLKREGSRLRSVEWRRAILERLVYPVLGARPITQIRRSEIIRLLDTIEDESGPVMADRTLAVVRAVMNWHAVRDEDFRSPIVRGMARTKPKERARERTLADDELRAVWRAAESTEGPFGKFVQFLLLTGARRTEASAMATKELSGADWTLPAVRNKTKVDLVRPLSRAAMKVLDQLPKIGEGDLVFTTDGKRPMSGFSKFKLVLEKAALEELRKVDPDAKQMPRWTLHDLRRTARSLMSRAGVDSDHAEQCLGHVLSGVRGTYDRHKYHAEKKRAFEALAAQVEMIVNPQPKVVSIRARSKRR